MKLVRLGSVCNLRNGFAFKSEQFEETGVPIIRISDINGNFVNSEKAVRIKYNPQFENFRIDNGDLLIALSGATTGKYGIYNSGEIGYQNQRVGCFVVKDENKLDKSYLLQVLRLIKPFIERKAHGSGQPNISGKDIEELEIPLPPLPDQLHIANLLSKAENLIAQRKESIRLLAEYLKITFLEMFEEPILNPKKWELNKLEKISDVGSSKRVFVEELVETGIPFYRGTEIGKLAEGIEIIPNLYITKKHFEELKSHTGVPIIGDLLMPSICPDGRIFRVVNNDSFYFKDGRVLWVKPNQNIINSIYLHYTLKRLFITNYNKIASGTTFAELKIVALKKILVPTPPIELQTQFAQIVEKTETLKTQYQISLQELENLYGSLSQRAFRGELSINKAIRVY